MLKVNFQQGSQEWLDWRKGLLTATEAPILMGASPYCTALEGWKRKTGQIPGQVVNLAMLRGQRDEPIAREMFIKETGINMIPSCIESSLYNFLGASLDGLSECESVILEIKSNADHYHKDLETKHIIPEFHWMQIQHQMFCGDGTIKMAYYVSYNKGKILIKEIFPDINWMNEYFKEAKEYWRKCVFFEAPALSLKDYEDKNYDLEFCNIATEYRNIDLMIKELEEKKNHYKKQLVTLCEDKNCIASGIKILKKSIKGRIDYEKIPELENINTEKYRKEIKASWVILIDDPYIENNIS